MPSAVSSTSSCGPAGSSSRSSGGCSLQRSSWRRPPCRAAAGRAPPDRLAVLGEGALLDGDLVGAELAVPPHLVLRSACSTPVLRSTTRSRAVGVDARAGRPGRATTARPSSTRMSRLGRRPAPSPAASASREVAGEPVDHRRAPRARSRRDEPARRQPEPAPARLDLGGVGRRRRCRRARAAMSWTSVPMSWRAHDGPSPPPARSTQLQPAAAEVVDLRRRDRHRLARRRAAGGRR